MNYQKTKLVHDSTDFLMRYKYLLILDLEATCCDQGSISQEDSEIIEIGAIIVNTKSATKVDEFNIFVKPEYHPILTKFCIELTSIKQDDINAAPGYKEAVGLFMSWLQRYTGQYIFCSWGGYDKRQFRRESNRKQVAVPVSDPHLNLRKMFTAEQKLDRLYGVQEALELVGFTLAGTLHRAIDDVHNIQKLLPFCLGRKKLIKN